MMLSSEKIELAKQACLSHGLQVTEKRVSLLYLLMRQERAITAYELADEYENTFSKPVAIITVYRVLKSLQEKGLAHKLSTINRFVACKQSDKVYAHSASQFLICKHCLNVEEINLGNAVIKELEKGIAQTDFVFNQLQLEMSGECKCCLSLNK